jgi:predicted tellurium resistance membrane protein TerC
MEIFSLENLFTLIMLTMLQAVLGFDNLLYISLESKRVKPEKQATVRRWGIGLAVALRIVLLFALIEVISLFQNTLFAANLTGFIEGDFNLHSIVVLLGGVFIIYTAVKEITHMLVFEDLSEEKKDKTSFIGVIAMIVTMNLVFSFDSILSAMALTDIFGIMALAIVIGGVLMIWLSDRVAVFLEKNRMYEVIGLFILFVVGIMLLSEGAHMAHLKVFGHEILPMSKATFYFVIFVVVLVDIVQTRYASNLMKQNHAHISAQSKT